MKQIAIYSRKAKFTGKGESIKNLEESLADLNKVQDNTNNPETEDNESDESGVTELYFGSTISFDFVEMSVEDVQWYDELKPSVTSGVYSYQGNKDGETYLALKGKIKNIAGDAYSIDNMTVEFIIDNKYTYSGWLIGEDQDGKGFYGDYLKPLQETTFYIYASIPDELKEMYTSGIVKFAFSDNFSKNHYKDFEEQTYQYQINYSK